MNKNEIKHFCLECMVNFVFFGMCLGKDTISSNPFNLLIGQDT